MALRNPEFERVPLEVVPAPDTAVSLCCAAKAHRVNAVTHDEGLIVIGSFNKAAGMSIDIEHDAPAAYQCAKCGRMMYLAV